MTGPDHAAEHCVEKSEQHDRAMLHRPCQGDESEKTYPSRTAASGSGTLNSIRTVLCRTRWRPDSG
jgi:hypothetical protein